VNRNRCLNLLRRANAHLERFFASCSHQITFDPDEELEVLLQVERILRSVGALLGKDLDQDNGLVTRKELARHQANLVRLRRELAGVRADAPGGLARLFMSPRRPATLCSDGAMSRGIN
jgi:hypothetical protein